MKSERRLTSHRKAPVRLRNENGIKHISGYAAVFFRDQDPTTEYWLTENIVERISPGAFANVSDQDVLGVFNHNDEILLGRSSNTTMSIQVDEIGMRYEIAYDDTDPDHQRVAAKLERGDLTGSSFAFYNSSSEWETITRNGREVQQRTITDAGIIYDVGPVSLPAYSGTLAGIRSAVVSRSEVEAIRAMADQQVGDPNLLDFINMEADFLGVQK